MTKKPHETAQPADRTPAPATESPRAGPVVVHPNAVYTLDGLREAFPWLAKSTIGREIRLGRLRASKRCGRVLVTGAWLLSWIEGGELRRRRRAPEASVNGSAE